MRRGRQVVKKKKKTLCMDRGMLLHMAVGIYHDRLQTSPEQSQSTSLCIHALFCSRGAENIVDPDVKKLLF